MEHCKMNLVPIVLLVFLFKTHDCHPRGLKLPDLDVSRPEEVNSLELEEPYRRSFGSNGVEETIRQVEDIIKSNPALPRLTRGEILDLLENITQVDSQKSKILGKNRDGKAIMVVMPFTPTNDKNMEDLYTKAPVTHMIGEPFHSKDEVKEVKHSRRRPPVQFNDTDNDLVKKTTLEEKKRYSTTKPTTTSAGTSTRLSVRRRTTTTTTPTTYRPRTRRPVRRRTTTQHPNHRYSEVPPTVGGITIIESPKLGTTSQIDDLSVQENVRHEVVVSAPITEQNDIIIPDNLKDVIKDMNLDGFNTTQLEEQVKVKNMLADTTTSTTTKTSAPSAENVVDSLTPEMRELLMSFGLLPTPTTKPVVTSTTEKYYPEKAEVKPESYIGFKPLPDDGPSRGDMEALLASFGLGRSARKEKSLVPKTTKNVLNFDMIPDNFKDVITDLGISESNRNEKSVQKQHVFNPDTQYATEEELMKLEQLIGMIKQLEKLNGTATAEDLKKIDLETLKELVSSLNNHTSETLDLKEINSPDPTGFDEGLSRNEVKRQESTTDSSTTASSSTTTSTTTSSSVADSGTPSLTDLEASFGGQTEAVTEPPVPETTTRRNGFYYLVDWNTFLDIDDTKGRRVNLRFQPKIGDPKRFLSV